jgi:16S rRNA (uracil1498-N3)-methyltransferase
LSSGQSIELDPPQVNYLGNVLRMGEGAELLLFDGQSGEWLARIAEAGKRRIILSVERQTREAETVPDLWLAFAPVKRAQTDWLVEKATELGVASIQPLVTARAVLRVAGERAQKKQEHWQAIAAAACEQSGRNRLPAVHVPLGLGDWLAQAPRTNRFVLSLAPQAARLNISLLTGTKDCVLLSGPEGGLEAREEEAAIAAGFAPVSLGSRILRAETAPIAALSLLTLS